MTPADDVCLHRGSTQELGSLESAIREGFLEKVASVTLWPKRESGFLVS